MAERRPTFRWNAVAFAAVTLLVILLAIALLVLLDPRSQEWWGERFSELGTFFRSVLDAVLPR